MSRRRRRREEALRSRPRCRRAARARFSATSGISATFPVWKHTYSEPGQYVVTLTERDHFTLVDFDADAAAAASRCRAPSEQTAEDLQDLLKVWRQRLSPSQNR